MSLIILTLMACGAPYDTYKNYPGIDHDADVAKLMEEYETKGYVTECSSADQVRRIVGGDFVMSKPMLIEKQKFGPSKAAMTTRKRAVLNFKTSGISKATRLRFKTELPKATDAVNDELDMIADAKPDEEVDVLIIDFSDAFWIIPNAPGERKLFVTKVGDQFYNHRAYSARQQKCFSCLEHFHWYCRPLRSVDIHGFRGSPSSHKRRTSPPNLRRRPSCYHEGIETAM